jgi:putative ABC transport system permease protein
MSETERKNVPAAAVKLPTRRLSLDVTGGMLESVRIALDSLRSNKLRTTLTMLGIIIGVWSVVSLLSIGNGARQSITDQVRSIGTNLLSISPGAERRNGPPQVTSTSKTLTLDDADALQRAIPEIQYIAPEYQNGAQIVAGSQNRNAQVIGVTPDYAIVRNVTVASGQFLTDQMVRSARLAAVLGGKLAQDIYGTSNPVGQTIRVKSQPFLIVGVLSPAGGFSNYDNAVIIPMTTAHRLLFGGKSVTGTGYQVSDIVVQVRSADQLDLAQAKIELYMRKRHQLPDDGRSDDFTVLNQATLLSTVNTVTTTLTIFLSAIAGISLLVGGIGVMNIMLVSVTERTKEIGLRKAVGAKKRDILRQFLVEALVMSMLGGVLGLLLGYGTAMGIKAAFSQYITPIVTPSAVLLAIGFSAAVGLFFGIYPAQRAARLNQIQALRYE